MGKPEPEVPRKPDLSNVSFTAKYGGTRTDLDREVLLSRLGLERAGQSFGVQGGLRQGMKKKTLVSSHKKINHEID